MEPIKLPSGNTLAITVSSFSVSKALYQAVLEEAKDLQFSSNTKLDEQFFKDAFCSALSSQKIERCLWECMKKCIYGELKIDQDTFEPEEARQDYILVCWEVAKANLLPFMKSLYAQLKPLLGKLKKDLA